MSAPNISKIAKQVKEQTNSRDKAFALRQNPRVWHILQKLLISPGKDNRQIVTHDEQRQSAAKTKPSSLSKTPVCTKYLCVSKFANKSRKRQETNSRVRHAIVPNISETANKSKKRQQTNSQLHRMKRQTGEAICLNRLTKRQDAAYIRANLIHRKAEYMSSDVRCN